MPSTEPPPLYRILLGNASNQQNYLLPLLFFATECHYLGRFSLVLIFC